VLSALVMYSFVYVIEPVPYVVEIPAGFDELPVPAENALTESRVELGRRLFYDKIMSLDSTVSCATCHKPELAFTDGLKTSVGIRGQHVLRNSPTLGNVGYQDRIMRDNGVPSLEMQIHVPIQESNEFDFEIRLIANRMKQNSIYMELSQLAYNRVPDAYVITKALAAFERTLITGNSLYDQQVYQKKSGRLTPAMERGMELFFSDSVNCASCHSGFNFTNQQYANNGLYKAYADSGRMRITHDEIDRDMFEVPTLRNIALTSPYMHDGSMNTLRQVVDHYAKGGTDNPHKSAEVTGFTLSESQKQDLVLFLHSLTDVTFIKKEAALRDALYEE